MVKLRSFPLKTLKDAAVRAFKQPDNKLRVETSPIVAHFDKWAGIRKTLAQDLKIHGAYPNLEHNMFARLLSSPSRYVSSARVPKFSSHMPRDLLVPFVLRSGLSEKTTLVPAWFEPSPKSRSYALNKRSVLESFAHKSLWRRLLPRNWKVSHDSTDFEWLESTPAVVKQYYTDQIAACLKTINFSVEKVFFKRFPDKRESVVALDFVSEGSKPYTLTSIKNRTVFTLQVTLFLEPALLKQLSDLLGEPKVAYVDISNESAFDLVKNLYLLAMYEN